MVTYRFDIKYWLHPCCLFHWNQEFTLKENLVYNDVFNVSWSYLSQNKRFENRRSILLNTKSRARRHFCYWVYYNTMYILIECLIKTRNVVTTQFLMFTSFEYSNFLFFTISNKLHLKYPDVLFITFVKSNINHWRWQQTINIIIICFFRLIEIAYY
jgi:hypothetical protein